MNGDLGPPRTEGFDVPRNAIWGVTNGRQVKLSGTPATRAAIVEFSRDAGTGGPRSSRASRTRRDDVSEPWISVFKMGRIIGWIRIREDGDAV